MLTRKTNRQSPHAPLSNSGKTDRQTNGRTDVHTTYHPRGRARTASQVSIQPQWYRSYNWPGVSRAHTITRGSSHFLLLLVVVERSLCRTVVWLACVCIRTYIWTGGRAYLSACMHRVLCAITVFICPPACYATALFYTGLRVSVDFSLLIEAVILFPSRTYTYGVCVRPLARCSDTVGIVAAT